MLGVKRISSSLVEPSSDLNLVRETTSDASNIIYLDDSHDKYRNVDTPSRFSIYELHETPVDSTAFSEKVSHLLIYIFLPHFPNPKEVSLLQSTYISSIDQQV